MEGGAELGTLGETTYVQALGNTGADPTDVDMFLGPDSVAYVEIVVGDGASKFRGLILASAPDGEASGAGFARDSADVVMQLNDGQYDAEVARPFRSRSEPDTFGEFREDGVVGSVLAGDAANVRVLLYAD